MDTQTLEIDGKFLFNNDVWKRPTEFNCVKFTWQSIVPYWQWMNVCNAFLVNRHFLCVWMVVNECIDVVLTHIVLTVFLSWRNLKRPQQQLNVKQKSKYKWKWYWTRQTKWKKTLLLKMKTKHELNYSFKKWK